MYAILSVLRFTFLGFGQNPSILTPTATFYQWTPIILYMCILYMYRCILYRCKNPAVEDPTIMSALAVAGGK
jgi:hypothetical protein